MCFLGQFLRLICSLKLKDEVLSVLLVESRGQVFKCVVEVLFYLGEVVFATANGKRGVNAPFLVFTTLLPPRPFGLVGRGQAVPPIIGDGHLGWRAQMREINKGTFLPALQLQQAKSRPKKTMAKSKFFFERFFFLCLFQLSIFLN